jgi:hypothetical protein
MAICLIAKPFHAAAWRTIAMLFLGVALLWATNFELKPQAGKGRTISFDQFYTNFLSIFGHAHDDGLDSNKEWRVEWWREIVSYTIHGRYFWTGKGFGINLADDDGFQVMRDGSLRSPHNVHMTVLARMGVPGAALWALALLTWLAFVGSAFWRARRRRDEHWAGLFLFLFAYFAAFAINGSFDVFIEGPMGGIWFWTIFGVGVGALWVYRHHPEVLEPLAARGRVAETDGMVNAGARRPQLLPAAGWRRPGLPLGAGAARVARD